jgi:hypothetical protein
MITTFNPAVHGYHFSNDNIEWEWGPLSGKNLCGGMVYAALDYFRFGMCIPQMKTPPAQGTKEQQYILDRQWDAHRSTIPLFGWAYVVEVGNEMEKSLEQYTKLEEEMGKGSPVIMCLVGAYEGHHVMATAIRPATKEIDFYDPNYPDKTVTYRPAGKHRWSHSIEGAQRWHGFFVDPDANIRKVPPVFCGESNWRWCFRCEGLHWGGGTGVCPAGGAHVTVKSPNYTLAINAGNGQGEWKWCKTCQGLWFSGRGSPGRCPTGGGHDATDKNVYFMAQNTGAGEPDWRFCKKCMGMFWSGHPTKGKCPATGEHDLSESGNYSLMFG